MRMKGIAPQELFRVPRERLAEMFARGKKLPNETLEVFEQHYEYKR